jgi:predicted Zn-ribbon and HTH transcriptional regulator
MFVETKAGERDRVAVGRVWRTSDSGSNKTGLTQEAVIYPDRIAATGCPSVLEVARCESGDLADSDQIAIWAHASRCPRCESSFAEIRLARLEILGPTAHAASARAHQAAERIQALLRLALH